MTNKEKKGIIIDASKTIDREEVLGKFDDPKQAIRIALMNHYMKLTPGYSRLSDAFDKLEEEDAWIAETDSRIVGFGDESVLRLTAGKKGGYSIEVGLRSDNLTHNMYITNRGQNVESDEAEQLVELTGEGRYFRYYHRGKNKELHLLRLSDDTSEATISAFRNPYIAGDYKIWWCEFHQEGLVKV